MLACFWFGSRPDLLNLYPGSEVGKFVIALYGKKNTLAFYYLVTTSYSITEHASKLRHRHPIRRRVYGAFRKGID